MLKLQTNPLNVVEKLYRSNNYDHGATCFILARTKTRGTGEIHVVLPVIDAGCATLFREIGG